MHIKSLLLTLISIFVMTSCNNKAAENETTAAPKQLILYYSQTNTTKAVAEELQRLTGADIEAIEAVVPYDGTYDETIQRGLEEMQSGKAPEIKPLQSKIADYDVIYLAYPIWFGTYANPIMGVVDGYDFAGKKIVPIVTFGSGGLETSAAALKAKLPETEIAEGYGVRQARIDAMPKELNRFLIEGGYIEGEITPLPDFGEVEPIHPEYGAIYNEAVEGYPFPLGEPVTAQVRDTEDGTEYKFNVISKDMQGNEVPGIVYVLVAPEQAPVFTKVVR